MHPYDSIPPLAGIATPSSAAQIGWSVDENVRRLLRLQWAERRLMATMIARLTAEPVWEVKCALALHQWQCAEHVDAMRRRIGEMRNPVPRMDVAPDDAADLERYFDELACSHGTAELVAGIYAVTVPALARAFQSHVAGCNPLVDYPTARVLRQIVADLGDAEAWGAAALEAIRQCGEPARRAMESWCAHLSALLDADGASPDPMRSTSQTARPDFHPRRDERFHGKYNFEFPPHVVYTMPDASPEERNLALVCKRTLEMDVPEMMASFMTERADQPWEFYLDYSRQLWDEARHAMMGSVALEARGVDWKRDVPLNVSFALRLNLHATPVERQIMLFAIEQSLMPAETGKRFEYETAEAAGDALSAHFQDYDWADEVLHTQIGRRALKRDGISPETARARAQEIHEKTWAALAHYRHLDEQSDWWPAFVRATLGRESAATQAAPPGLNIFNE